MALLDHQKLIWVLPTNPYGRGTLGAYSSATAPTITNDSCSGTATSTTLTTAGSTFANGDLIKIIQTRGTGAGQWEIALVASGGGSTSLTLTKALTYTYTDSGASQAQAIKINEYTDVTVQAGTWSPAAWNQNVSGIITLAHNGVMTLTGNVAVSSAGFRPGYQHREGNNSGQCAAHTGEGYAADYVYACGAASDNAGTGGHNYSAGAYDAAGGGGGGNGTGGANGNNPGGAAAGSGGLVGGINTLQSMVFGGGGGAGGAKPAESHDGAAGGAGAGIISIWGRSFVNNGGSFLAVGANGGGGLTSGGGGGGAGGSILCCWKEANIGTDKYNTNGGNGGAGQSSNGNGGAGGKGRIAIYYGTTLTGTISSTLYGTLLTEKDSSLVEIIPATEIGYTFFI